MRRPMRRPHYLELENVENYQGAADWIIYQRGANYIGLSGLDGTVLSKNADAATVIQAVIDAVPISGNTDTGNAHGAHIVLQFDDAIINTCLEADTAIRMNGHCKGGGTCLRLGDNVDDSLIRMSTGGENFGTVLEHINFEGNKANNDIGGVALVHLDGYPTMRNCFIMRSENMGLHNEGQDTHLTNVYVEYCDGAGIKLDGGQNQNLLNCTSWDNGGYGMLVSCDRFSMFGCRIMNNALDGFYSSGERNRIIGNHFELNGECGVYLGGSKHSTIANNTFDDNSQKTDNTYSHVELHDSEYCVVEGNTFSGAETDDAKYCVEETGGSNAFNTICCNTCKDAQSGTISVEAGSGTPINGYGTENAAAETPQLAWPIGTIVDFTDSADASGDGIYIKDAAGNWDKLA